MVQELILFVIFVNAGYTCYAQESINFNLENACIESVSYSLAQDSLYSVFIKLNPDCAREFKNFTRKNIGKLLKILKNEHLIVEAVVKGEIGSGLISINNLKDSNEVLQYLEILIK